MDEFPSMMELYHMNHDAAEKAAQFGAEFIDLNECSFPPDLLARVPAVIARSYEVLPLYFNPQPQQQHPLLQIAISDPSDLEALDDLCALLRYELIVSIADHAQLRQFINKLYPPEN